MTKDEFIKYCLELNIEINDIIYNKFERYYELLIDWNNKFNMTTITEKADVFLLHFYDSLCLNKAIDLKKYNNICDFGVGAGFPGMPIAIVFENLCVTLIESNQKKCLFLEKVKEELKLNNVNIINDRIENYSLNNREKYDLITCRAVSSIPVILECSISALKVNGFFIPLKSNCLDEINRYKYLEKELDIKLENIIEYNLKINNAYRSIPIYKKLKITKSKYPRNYNKIIKEYKK